MERRLDMQVMSVPPGAWPGILAILSEIDEFKGWWSGRRAFGAYGLGELRGRALRRSASSSVGIDWSGVPRAQAPYARGPGVDPADAERTRAEAGYATLLGEVCGRHREMALGNDLVRRIHAGILKHLDRDRGHRGAWRTVPDRALLLPERSMEALTLRPADPSMIPEAMEALTRWAEVRIADRSFHPLLVTACFVLEFLAMRPFVDGNGRVSRILTVLMLLRSGYDYAPYAPLESVVAERKTEYYLALRRSQASRVLQRSDMGPWFLAFLGALRIHAGGLRSVLEQRPAAALLSRNQKEAMRLAERRREITNRMLSKELSLPRETAKQVLNRLVALNLLVREGAGRATRYRQAG